MSTDIMFFKKIRSRRKRNLAYIITTLIIILAVTAISSFYIVYTQSQLQKMLLSTEGFIEMEVEKLIPVGSNTLIQLKNDCSELAFYISPWQASSIQEGIENTTPFRPSTHDILVDILEGYGIEPMLVKITKLSDRTYFAELTLKRGSHFLTLDTRPSDAIALAVRTDTPVYVNESLIMKVC